MASVKKSDWVPKGIRCGRLSQRVISRAGVGLGSAPLAQVGVKLQTLSERLGLSGAVGGVPVGGLFSGGGQG